MGDTRLGFIGAGFVGGAMIRAFSGHFPISVYDKGKDIGTLREVVEGSDILFVSLPTPEDEDGCCDTTILDSVIQQVNEILDETERLLPVVVRSTVTPTWFDKAYNDNDKVELMYMPEFLTARTADLDFIMSSRFILGCENDDISTPNEELVQAVFEKRFPRTRFVRMTWEEASLVKYATNCFFTVKISFFNELFNVCKSMDTDPQRVIEEVMNDGRIGRSHFQVPGPDGKRGWGGACFPKDSSEWVHGFGEKEGEMVRAARKVNRLVRRNMNG